MPHFIETKAGVVELYLRKDGKSFWCTPPAEEALSYFFSFSTITASIREDKLFAIFSSAAGEKLSEFEVHEKWNANVQFPYPNPPGDYLMISKKDLDKMQRAVTDLIPPGLLEKLMEGIVEESDKLVAELEKLGSS